MIYTTKLNLEVVIDFYHSSKDITHHALLSISISLCIYDDFITQCFIKMYTSSNIVEDKTFFNHPN